MAIRLADIPPCPYGCPDSHIEVVEEQCAYYRLTQQEDGTFLMDYVSQADDGEPRTIRYGCCATDLPPETEKAIAEEMNLDTTNFWNILPE